MLGETTIATLEARPVAGRAVLTGRLDSLTGLRFYAALLVVVTHVSRNFFGAEVGSYFSMGSVGVSFFFVLSGFVLMWSRKHGQRRADFYRNRFARVYPLHAVMLSAAVLLLVSQAGAVDWAALVACIALLQAWVPFDRFYFALNGPAWSLSCEFFFYAMFPAVAKRLVGWDAGKLLRGGAILYGVVCVLTLAAHIVLKDGPTIGVLYVNPAYRIWEFLLGVGLGVAMRQGWRTRVRPSLAAWGTALLFVAVSALNVGITNNVGPLKSLPMQALPSDLASLALTPCFVMLIAVVAASDLHGTRSHLASRPMVLLGQWSFALYLSHLIVVEIIARAIPAGMSWVLALPLSLTTIAITVAVAAGLYTFIERPIEARLRAPRRRHAAI